MNPMLQQLKNHRSIRQFTDQPISAALRHAILEAAKMASTSQHIQATHIIRITDPTIRKKLREICSNQVYVESAAEFWVFCADFAKHAQIVPNAELDWAEWLLVGAIDTGIFAQNVLTAAEASGLGGVFIGSLRNDIEQVDKLLKLPQYVVPLVGMCLGYPAQDPMLRPRFPVEMLCSENEYRPLDPEKLAEFDAEISAYYQARSQKDLTWSDYMKGVFAEQKRPQILAYLQSKGLLTR
ncbi:oxygen-insensitive NADPH nitroreductase [Rodentibacter myodis]|uniref:Nitroreductase A n=1 Tax=Rodentibacter myodis TaxID=1907939 RepID=A0A1V3JHN5_9PAST|nr:oxygen-insensitive NADPH nitroreductase [Rodentibacter myodis]OOF56341.1 nitroreductase A [Rodentibacter myodis]